MIANLFRRYHRWVSLPVAVFIAGIAVTGILLHIDLMRYPPQEGPPPASQSAGMGGPGAASPSPPPGPPPGASAPDPGGPSGEEFRQHRFLISLHTGDFMGPVGRYIYLTCGVVLLFLAASGLWLYVDMFARRFRNGRRGLFWN